jgi:hypothetical protein
MSNFLIKLLIFFCVATVAGCATAKPKSEVIVTKNERIIYYDLSSDSSLNDQERNLLPVQNQNQSKKSENIKMPNKKSNNHYIALSIFCIFMLGFGIAGPIVP